MEYNEMAKYYDAFYSNKSYDKETKFLVKLLGNRKNILDVGCGTGIHMAALENRGYTVDGIDLSKDMLNIAKTRVNGNLYKDNLLNFKLNKKYDAIISMFAVFNHLKNYNEFKIGINNLYNHLNDNGMIIIDLHNGRENGSKIDKNDNLKRIMSWTFDKSIFKETSKIKYIIDNNEYNTEHTFLIYQIEKLKNVLDELNLNYKFYENYTLNKASDKSKNIQIVITR